MCRRRNHSQTLRLSDVIIPGSLSLSWALSLSSLFLPNFAVTPMKVRRLSRFFLPLDQSVSVTPENSVIPNTHTHNIFIGKERHRVRTNKSFVDRNKRVTATGTTNIRFLTLRRDIVVRREKSVSWTFCGRDDRYRVHRDHASHPTLLLDNHLLNGKWNNLFN